MYLLQRILYPFVSSDRRRHHPDKISLDYTETLMAASGHQAEASMRKTMEEYPGEYVLCVEGSVPMGADGAYCCIGGKSAIDILQEAAAGAKAIIAWGSCACNGCVQASQAKSHRCHAYS